MIYPWDELMTAKATKTLLGIDENDHVPGSVPAIRMPGRRTKWLKSSVLQWIKDNETVLASGTSPAKIAEDEETARYTMITKRMKAAGQAELTRIEIDRANKEAS